MNQKETDKEFIARMKNFDGCGYGDPEARLNDDRKLKIIFDENVAKNTRAVKCLTWILVILTAALVIEPIFHF